LKFKLNKAEHLYIFSLLNRLEKTKLSIKENKSSTNESLIFYIKNDKLNLYVNTMFCESGWSLIDLISEEDYCFALDMNLFYSAFNNFPADEIQFVYNFEENTLIFGNKKTRVALKTTPCNKPPELKEHSLLELDAELLIEAFKMTSFSCSYENDDYPYNSINFNINGTINSQSSDKHRISFFGEVDKNNSYIIDKQTADVLVYFLDRKHNFQYSLDLNKLLISWQNGYIVASLGSKADIDTFDNLYQFLDANFVLSCKLDRQSFLKSLKFVSSITNSLNTELNFCDDKLSISGNSSDKGAVVDSITLDNNVESIKVSYLSSHLIKILEILSETDIIINILEFNSYNLLMIESGKFEHILFPME